MIKIAICFSCFCIFTLWFNWSYSCDDGHRVLYVPERLKDMKTSKSSEPW